LRNRTHRLPAAQRRLRSITIPASKIEGAPSTLDSIASWPTRSGSWRIRRSFCSLVSVPIVQSTTAQCSATTGTTGAQLKNLSRRAYRQSGRAAACGDSGAQGQNAHVPVSSILSSPVHLDHIFEGVNGDSIIAAHLSRGNSVESCRRQRHVIDDAHRRRLGTSPFDARAFLRAARWS